jgi:SAM-dependent methyltransferase
LSRFKSPQQKYQIAESQSMREVPSVAGHYGLPMLTTARRESYVRRYQTGEWRTSVFADMVLDDVRRQGPSCVVVDIGCGGGFDGSRELQEHIAACAGNYIGVEPDVAMKTGPHFSVVHRCLFEAAPIEPASVDVAFAVMVAEHIEHPRAFMAHVAHILRDGGVFWAFTIDLRHWSAWSSLLLEQTGLKNLYLNMLHGKRGEDRYHNYPVQYRLNTPRQVRRYAGDFAPAEFISFSRVGAEDYNLPGMLRPMNHVLDRALAFAGAPGSNLAFRLVRSPRSSR